MAVFLSTLLAVVVLLGHLLHGKRFDVSTAQLLLLLM